MLQIFGCFIDIIKHKTIVLKVKSIGGFLRGTMQVAVSEDVVRVELALEVFVQVNSHWRHLARIPEQTVILFSLQYIPIRGNKFYSLRFE